MADLARSLRFYQDVLGFTGERSDGGGPVTVARGAAAVHLDAGDAAYDSTFARRPSGSAILWFGTDSVDALHAEFAARGAAPSAIERANGLKQRMFEVRDPDGHVLWFGQSFAEPVREPPPPLFEKAMPSFRLRDVPAAVAWYRDVLGCSINYQQDDFAVMERDRTGILLYAREPADTSVGACYIYVRDADAVYDELRRRGAGLLSEPVSRPWGLRDFTVLDPDGNAITLGQPFE